MYKITASKKELQVEKKRLYKKLTPEFKQNIKSGNDNPMHKYALDYVRYEIRKHANILHLVDLLGKSKAVKFMMFDLGREKTEIIKNLQTLEEIISRGNDVMCDGSTSMYMKLCMDFKAISKRLDTFYRIGKVFKTNIWRLSPNAIDLLKPRLDKIYKEHPHMVEFEDVLKNFCIVFENDEIKVISITGGLNKGN